MAKTITVSFSELDCFKQCPHKHRLAYKDRWVSDQKAPALARGTLWHLVLEHHYRTIQAAQRAGCGVPTVDELATKVLPLLYLPDGSQDEEQTLIEWMYLGYLEQYGLDPYWDVVAVEHAPEVYLPTERGGRSRFKLKLKIDLIVRAEGRVWVVDHKSCKDLPRQKELDLDDQFGLYTWAMRQLGKKVFGSIHNAARTHRNKDPESDPRARNAEGLFLNKDGSVSKVQPQLQPLDERFARARLYRTDEELQSLAVDAYRTAKMAYSLALDSEPRHTDPDRCGWRCNFTEPCLAGRKGIDEVEVLLGSGFRIDRTRH